MSLESALPGTATEPRWRGLFLAGAAGAALTALLIPLQVVVFIAWPPPASRSVADWFVLFETSPVLGLVSLDLLMMVEQILVVPVVLALWVLLRGAGESMVTLAAVIWLIAATLMVGSNTGFEMLSLSHGYAAASGEVQRAAYLAAGQGMLASYFDMGTGFVFGYVLTSVAGLALGIVMLRTAAFPRAAGWALAGGSLVGFGLFLPGIGVPLALLSVLFLLAWYVLVARALVRLAGGLRLAAAPRMAAVRG